MRRPFVASLVLIAILTGPLSCGAPDGSPDGDGVSCLAIDRLSTTVVPLAGLRVHFRALDCAGLPVRSLDRGGDVTVADPRTDTTFGVGRGRGCSIPATPRDLVRFTVLALDLSDATLAANRGHVVAAARAFVRERVQEPEADAKHRVALLVFGEPGATRVTRPFSDDAEMLLAALDEVAAGGGLGPRDLYGAYMTAFDEVVEQGRELAHVERFVVLVTGGPHAAGDDVWLREQALATKTWAEEYGVTLFGVASRGDYDESRIRELASHPAYALIAEDAASLPARLETVGRMAESVATSNYVVGVCVPEMFRGRALTLRVAVDDAIAERSVRYETSALDGDVSSCDAEAIATPCRDRECGPGALPDVACGSCAEGLSCSHEGRCVDPCEGRACGPGSLAGFECGDCRWGTDCEDGACRVPACEFDCDDMVRVAGGAAPMGCDGAREELCDEHAEPAHEVDVAAFRIDRREVTVAAYRACVDAGGCDPAGLRDGCNARAAGRDEHPVNCLDWDDARAWCEWAGKRLCSEAEWERAARGTDGRAFPWGDEPADCDRAVMRDGCGEEATWPAGSKPAGASPCGALDMAGNVWEWVADDWHDSYDGAPADGAAWLEDPATSSRVRRGGGWNASASSLRASVRGYALRSYDDVFLGFRCCRSEP